MIGAVLTAKQQELREEARAFVREAVPRDLLVDMEAERVRYPRRFLEEAGDSIGLRRLSSTD